MSKTALTDAQAPGWMGRILAPGSFVSELKRAVRLPPRVESSRRAHFFQASDSKTIAWHSPRPAMGFCLRQASSVSRDCACMGPAVSAPIAERSGSMSADAHVLQPWATPAPGDRYRLPGRVATRGDATLPRRLFSLPWSTEHENLPCRYPWEFRRRTSAIAFAAGLRHTNGF